MGQLKVIYKNNVSDYTYEKTALPDRLIKGASGDTAFRQELPLVWPITGHPIHNVNSQSQSLIQRHASLYASHRIHQQRQTLSAIPVAEVDYVYDSKPGRFWVYGN